VRTGAGAGTLAACIGIGGGCAAGAEGTISSKTPAGAIRGCTGIIWDKYWFAKAVPSAPQLGHATGEGIRPLMGSTSKAYRCPQLHSSLTDVVTKPESLN